MSHELNDAASKLTGLLSGTQPKEPPQEPEKQEMIEQEAVETEEIQAEAQEAEAETPDEGEARPEEAEQEPQSIELGADEFSSILGIEMDHLNVTDDGAVSFRVKGKEGDEDVPLEKLINAYQGDANLTNRSKQLAEQEKTIKAKMEELDSQSTQYAQKAAVMLEAISKEYNQEYESINWNQLRADDPTEYTLRKQEFGERKQRLESLVNQTLNMVNEAQSSAKQDEQVNLGQKLQKDQETMQSGFKNINVKVDKGLEESVSKFFGENFTDEELNSMTHHAPLGKLAIMAYKAMQYDKGMTKAKEKQVKKIPKVMKPGQKPKVEAIQVKAQKEAMSKFKQSGDMRDAAKVLRGRLRG